MINIDKRTKAFVLLLLKGLAIAICLISFFDQYFFVIDPFSVSFVFVLSFATLIFLNFLTRKKAFKEDFKPFHVFLIVVSLFFVVFFRTGFCWALGTFPLKDAYTVWTNLQEPFDAFAYSMIKRGLAITIPQTLVITIVLTVFLYALLNSTKKKMIGVGVYFAATIAFFVKDIPISDYIHLLRDEPEKNASYSMFFVENYVDPDSVIVAPPEQKRNLILIYLESLETTFSDRDHGGYQSVNLIPEITELAQQNLNFGKKNKKDIGGGFDALGSCFTYGAMHSRTLGIPSIVDYKKVHILHNYKSIYKILNDYGYKQIFFQGNPGHYDKFQYFTKDQKIDEIYGPEDLIQRLNLDSADLIKKHGFKTVQDKDAFKFARQILDTIQEPFSLTFFTIDTHSPSGIYDPECVKSVDESNEDERLKASIRCVSRELKSFLDALKTKSFYENTSVVVFGDHLFMGTSLVEGFSDRKWVDVFINPSKTPTLGENRLFSDIDMFPTILSSINFYIDGGRLGFGTDLFSDKKTLTETIGIDSFSQEVKKMPSFLLYKNHLLKKQMSLPKEHDDAR